MKPQRIGLGHLSWFGRSFSSTLQKKWLANLAGQKFKQFKMFKKFLEIYSATGSSVGTFWRTIDLIFEDGEGKNQLKTPSPVVVKTNQPFGSWKRTSSSQKTKAYQTYYHLLGCSSIQLMLPVATLKGQASFSRRNLGRPMPTLLTWGPSGFLRISWASCDHTHSANRSIVCMASALSARGKVLAMHQSNSNSMIHGNVQAYRYSIEDLPRTGAKDTLMMIRPTIGRKPGNVLVDCASRLACVT